MILLISGILNMLNLVLGGDMHNCNDCLEKQIIEEQVDCHMLCNNRFNDEVSDTMCPYIMCDRSCYHGYMFDENGCKLCECKMDVPLPNTGVDCTLHQPSCDGYRYVCPKITEITHCNEGGIDGYTTFQISLVLKPTSNIKNIYAIYGDENTHSLHIPAAYQSISVYGSNLGGVNPFLFQNYPTTQYDSWLTIGIDNGDLSNDLSSVGVDFDLWTEINDLDVNNGAIFIMNPDENFDNKVEYLLGQITVLKDSNPTVILNVQGRTVENERSWSETNIRFNLNSPQSIQYETIPLGCIIWYDGCNTCVVNQGNIGVCTRLMCFHEDYPRCLRYSNNGGH